MARSAADWDADSPRLRENLGRVFRSVRDAALRREPLHVALARDWQRAMMAGLAAPIPAAVGRFRGERGLKNYEVDIGDDQGVPAAAVATELGAFEQTLQTVTDQLDQLLAPGQEPTADGVAAVIVFAAWAHGEWVRIHPLANGNGRTARLWVNAIAMRYGLPLLLRLRPRPGDGYEAACAAAMHGYWKALEPVFQRMYLEALMR